MKTLKFSLFIFALVFTIESCAQKQAPEGVTAAQIDSLSYSIGVMLGMNFKESKLEYLDMSVFSKAVRDVFNDEKLKIEMAEANMIIQNHFMKIQEQEQRAAMEAGEKNLEEGIAFLSENKNKEGVIELPSGLQYKILTQGNGVKPTETDTVEVHYRGTLIDGTEFDSSYSRGETTTFPLNGVIKGWTEGLQQVGEGSKVELYVPAELAYGERSVSSLIQPNSTLIFEVELIKVKKAQ